MTVQSKSVEDLVARCISEMADVIAARVGERLVEEVAAKVVERLSREFVLERRMPAPRPAEAPTPEVKPPEARPPVVEKKVMPPEVLKLVAEKLMAGKAAEVKSLVELALENGVKPLAILQEGMLAGMSVIGERFKKNEVYVPEVLIAARAMKAGMVVLQPQLTASGVEPLGVAVIGTVKGDLHDIGKNLVGMMLEGAGFKVIDLGIDVAPEKFIQGATENKAQVIGVSALLTTTMTNMKGVVEAVKASDLSGKVRVMIGGAPVTQSFCDEIGADGYAPDAASAADLAKHLLQARKPEAVAKEAPPAKPAEKRPASVMLKAAAEAVMRGKAAEAKTLVQDALNAGIAPGTVLNESLLAGMSVIGERFKRNEVYVPEVLIAARAMKAGMEVLKPHLVAAGVKPRGIAVIGTVKGDLHDIGKNLVGMMLEGAGFRVVDAGIDVAPEKFVTVAKENQANVIGVSALLTTTMTNMKAVVEAVKAADLGGRVKVMIGGAPVTQAFSDEIGADGYAPDAASAADLAKQLMAAKEIPASVETAKKASVAKPKAGEKATMTAPSRTAVATKKKTPKKSPTKVAKAPPNKRAKRS